MTLPGWFGALNRDFRKPRAERGTYIHPELFGEPQEKAVERVRQPGSQE